MFMKLNSRYVSVVNLDDNISSFCKKLDDSGNPVIHVFYKVGNHTTFAYDSATNRDQDHKRMSRVLVDRCKEVETTDYISMPDSPDFKMGMPTNPKFKVGDKVRFVHKNPTRLDGISGEWAVKACQLGSVYTVSEVFDSSTSSIKLLEDKTRNDYYLNSSQFELVSQPVPGQIYKYNFTPPTQQYNFSGTSASLSGCGISDISTYPPMY